MDMNDIMKNFSSNQLRQINDFLNSAQGKNLQKNMNDTKKNELLNKFKQLDPNEVKNVLNGISKEAILKMLK